MRIVQRMPSTSKRDLVDRLLGGTLDDRLRAWRSDGLSHEAIAQILRTDHGITLSTATVCRWVNAMPVPVPVHVHLDGGTGCVYGERCES